MNISTLSSREFNQRASDAKRLADNGPVFITDRGRPCHVLLTIADYRRLTAQTSSIVSLLAMPTDSFIDSNIDLEIAPRGEQLKAAFL